jgi:energy-coupling factor transporter ATP-binding protein EcfA2
MILKPAHGNWVQGDRFWGREVDIELFTERIDEGANLLLVGQRRMGKTSLMRETARLLADRYLCVFVDFEKAESAADAIVELSIALRPYKTIWKKTKDLFRNILSQVAGAVEQVKVSDLTVTLRAGLTPGNWRSRHADLTHYEDRLKQVLGREALALAMEMLTEAAVTGELSNEAYRAFQDEPSLYPLEDSNIVEVQKEIIRVLEHDGYLERKGQSFVFVSNLARDWWKARNEFGYTPILQRQEGAK